MKKIIKFFYHKISVKSGIYSPKRKCYHNTVEQAIVNEEDSIVICFCLNKNSLFFHTVNSIPGVGFVDNTLGDLSGQYEYYLHSVVFKEQFLEVKKIFTKLKKKFIFIK